MPLYDEPFQAKVFNKLYSLRLQEVFSLRYLNEYDPDLGMEIIEGNAKIMMPRRSVLDSSLIKALWGF